MTALTATADHALGLAAAIAIAAAVLAYLALVIGAFFSTLTSPATTGMKLVWIVFIIIAPFIGSLLWFTIGKRNTTNSP